MFINCPIVNDKRLREVQFTDFQFYKLPFLTNQDKKIKF